MELFPRKKKKNAISIYSAFLQFGHIKVSFSYEQTGAKDMLNIILVKLKLLLGDKATYNS